MKTEINIKQGTGIWIFIVSALVCAVIGVSLYASKQNEEKRLISAENELLSGNVEALKNKVHEYDVRLNDSVEVHVARVQQLAVTAAQWKRLYNNEVRNVNRLESKLRDVKDIATASSVSKDTVRVPVIRNVKHEQVIDYRSKWIDIYAVIDTTGRTSELNYEKRDKWILVHLIERKSALWGWIRWGKKKEFYEAYSEDTKTKIIDFEVKKIID